MTHSLNLSSDTKNLAVLESFLTDVLRGHSMDEAAYHNAVVVFTEAVNNAMHHGNKRDASKTVEVDGRVEGTMLVLTIKDEGDGFNEAELPDPLHPDNLLREGGRGVFLIKAFSESVEFRNTDSGTVTTIHLKMQSE